MSQFTAKGCLPMRATHKDGVQKRCRRAWGEMRALDLDRQEKKRGEKDA